MYRLFASILPNITDVFNDLIEDRALDLHRCTNSVEIDAKNLESAVEQFCETPEFRDFCIEHLNNAVHVYSLDGDATVHLC